MPQLDSTARNEIVVVLHFCRLRSRIRLLWVTRRFPHLGPLTHVLVGYHDRTGVLFVEVFYLLLFLRLVEARELELYISTS